MTSRLSYAIGFDDAPFEKSHRGDVVVVGAVFNGPRLEGVLTGKVRRDGANATRSLIHMTRESRFSSSLRLILLQGITLAGFNVVDLPKLHDATGLPVIAVCRRPPDLEKMRRALHESVPGGARKWRLIEGLAPPRQANGVFLQCQGLGVREAAAAVSRWAVNSVLPEPLRTAHLIAGALADGESRHRP